MDDQTPVKKKIKRKKMVKKTKVEEPVQATVIEDAPAAPDVEMPTGPIPGQPLPHGYENPAPGDPGHKCVDLRGNYNPKWISLYVNPGPTVQGRLPFIGPGMRTWRLKVGEWADVPPWLFSEISNLKYDEIKMNYEGASALTQEGAEMVKSETFAFTFSYRYSA